MKIIVFANQKGGTGKTTDSINVSDCLATMGFKTLLIDLDPQASASTIYREPKNILRFVDDLFLDKEAKIEKFILKVKANLDLIPSNIHLAIAATQAEIRYHRESILINHLNKLQSYDYIIIDCPPTFTVLTINALYASDFLVIPINYAPYAIQGLYDLLEITRDVREQRTFRYSILRNGFDPRNAVTNRIIDEALKTVVFNGSHISENLFETVIRSTQSIPQAQPFGKSIFDFAPTSPAAIDFADFTNELLGELTDEKERSKP